MAGVRAGRIGSAFVESAPEPGPRQQDSHLFCTLWYGVLDSPAEMDASGSSEVAVAGIRTAVLAVTWMDGVAVGVIESSD